MTISVRIAAVSALALFAAGCSSIREHRGYIAEETLIAAIQPGIDNRQSVQGTLGTPTFTSQFGRETWYYISSTTSQRPFTTPRIRQHMVLAIQFDPAGNVATAQRSGMEKVVHLHPDSDKTPTLGRERSFFQDLFGNIGQVGSFGANAPQGGDAGGGGGPNGS
jgi:outer membrane protein assembly factor BamE (lipoprotein component of BamABCDE complex)